MTYSSLHSLQHAAVFFFLLLPNLASDATGEVVTVHQPGVTEYYELAEGLWSQETLYFVRHSEGSGCLFGATKKYTK